MDLTTSVPTPALPARDRRAQLAAFLRSRRERLRPDEVGLPAGGRRRTPGLRREEVAQLAGVGVTWYTWLEQGRDINASRSVLDAIARALRLDDPERGHVYTLAGLPDPVAEIATGSGVDEVTRQVLEQFEPTPALVLTPCNAIVAYNRTAATIFGDFSALPPARRNSMWLMFTEPYWQRLLADLDEHLPYTVAVYRGAMAEHLGEPVWEQLAEELCTVSERFRELWAGQAVAQPSPRVKRLVHPRVGLMRFLARGYWLEPRRGNRLIPYVPMDDATVQAVRTLVESGETGFRDWSDLAVHGAGAELGRSARAVSARIATRSNALPATREATNAAPATANGRAGQNQ